MKPIAISLILVFCATVAGGGIYVSIDNPPSIINYGGKSYSIFPSYGEQTLLEFVLTSLLWLGMFAGLLFSFKGAKTQNRNKANKMVLIGSTIFAFSYIFLIGLMRLKRFL